MARECEYEKTCFLTDGRAEEKGCQEWERIEPGNLFYPDGGGGGGDLSNSDKVK